MIVNVLVTVFCLVIGLTAALAASFVAPAASFAASLVASAAPFAASLVAPATDDGVWAKPDAGSARTSVASAICLSMVIPLRM